ncbi:MAG: sulfatase-like hydrolase/transferase [Verrucomicrobiota bacterium]|nr:sulfatase-like hydrolase/transferase [Verrucomicrobiota bacterium]
MANLLGLFFAEAKPPNVVVILTDDQGYADISFNSNHPKEVATPHMDALAREGVFFSQAYTSGAVCSPTRAGLMLGLYQQRLGIYTAGDGGRGFDPRTKIFPSFLPEDYTSMVVGKWHMGLDTDYPTLSMHALNRGFDECYKFMGRGGHDYFKLQGVKGTDYNPIYRNKTRLKDSDYSGYLTTRLTEEAVAFIDRQKQKPFFLYLAYNAVHAPAQAPKGDIERMQKQFPHLDPKRAILLAMLEHLDNGVGAVVSKLKAEGEWNNTLLFFLTDNGGSKAMQANNGRLRAFKGSLYEGGIRTPWIVSWPEKFKGGRTIDQPVISLDILPTVVEATGTGRLAKRPFDGKSLLPLLTEKTNEHHPVIFWNSGEEKAEWAVREGNWKAHSLRGKLELFDLANDPSEKSNLAAKHPALVKRLAKQHANWQVEMRRSAAEYDSAKPKQIVNKSKPSTRETKREQKRAERKKARQGLKKIK